MNSSPSLAGRALLALGLMVGFYLLALAIAAGLFFLPYAEWAYGDRLHPKLALACLVGGGLILWSVFPRVDRFVAPGPRLKRAEQPRLFAEIEAIAASTSQPMPSDVYLVGDVNAWVAQRGGLMGISSRRVMGVGLPLLRTLTCSQVRAVLAHEFGHFHGGDTRLGPLIYRTRAAIERTIVNLSKQGGSPLLQAPFRWYGLMFLRVTHSLSRRQELNADALAARTVGARPLMEGLRSISGAGRAFEAYWQSECGPVLGAGFLPPLADGFADFLRTEGVAEAVKKLVAEDMQGSKGSPYDTHPPLPERIAALEALVPGRARPDGRGAQREDAADPPAITLLEDVAALEAAWLGAVSSPGTAAKLKPIRWSDVGREVYAPYWRELAGANAENLPGLRALDLPALLVDSEALSKRLVGPKGEPPSGRDPRAFALGVCTAAVGLALLEGGAEIEALPGMPVALRTQSGTVDPADLVRKLADGTLPAEEWRAFCTRHGIDELDLGAVARRAGASGSPAP